MILSGQEIRSRLGTAFGIPSGVVVDTHVTRLSYRLGLTRETDAVKIERKLMQLLPQEEWIDFSHRLIWHGRRVCQARKPKCEECLLAEICPKVGVKPAKLKANVKVQRPLVAASPALGTSKKSSATRVARSRR